MKNAPPMLNLLRGRNRTFFDRFVDWALTFGRLVVICTEAIALSAFLYRFILDREIVDLNDSIQNKQALVKRLAHNEQIYRNLQEQLAVIKQLQGQAKQSTDIYRETFDQIPSDVLVNTYSMSKEAISLNTTMTSVNSLAALVSNLRENTAIDTISLDNIENKTDTGTLTIGLTATLKEPLLDYGKE